MMQKAMSYNQLYYLGVIPQDNDIYHHGILGMRWGVRHDHYPLSASEHTAAEKKAGYKKSIGGGTNESLYGRKAKKANRVANKFDKRIEKSKAYDEKILSAREKHEQKISEKYDKKIARVQKDIDSFKAAKDGIKDRKGREILTKEDVSGWVSDLKEAQNEIKAKKNAKLADFRDGTKAIKAGNKKYNQILESYKDAKLSALKDKAYKKNPDYKKAVRDYVFQSLRDANNYGVSGVTKLGYSGQAARSTIKKIKELKASGKTATQIAQMTGYSKATVERYA